MKPNPNRMDDSRPQMDIQPIIPLPKGRLDAAVRQRAAALP
ncbi:MAG TPA: hypothetical protein VE650_00740 [Acetobacteraceae bacterium]|jgi:hypothetical protein|nr:hypothetical protein [Acetobacteraceae bacterium]